MHYSAEKIRRSVGHFALAKTVTAVSAVVLLALLARVLAKGDYAIYVTLQALVLIIGAVTSFGINQAALRYLPEMRAMAQNRAMYRLLWRTAGTYCVAVTLGFAVCSLLLPWIAPGLGLEARWSWVLVYFVVGGLRLVGFFLSVAMEALLWPRISQYALAVSAGLKLVLAIGLAVQGRLSFELLVLIEAATESLALLALVLGLAMQQRRDPQRDNGDPHWIRTHHGRMRRFGRWNYVSSLLAQLSTSAPYRMLAAGLLAAEATALLGLAFSIGDLLHRFLPANMGRYLLRSVLVARASTGTEMHVVNSYLNLNFRVNAVLLSLFSGAMMAAGSGGVAVLTAGKYTGTGPLLAAIGLVLLLNLWRMQFDLLTSITEQVRGSVLGNLGLLAGLALAWACAPLGSIWGIVAGAASGQLAAVAAYSAVLRSRRIGPLFDSRTGLFFTLNLALGAVLRAWLPGRLWLVALALSGAGFVVLAFAVRPVRMHELRKLGNAAGERDMGRS